MIIHYIYKIHFLCGFPTGRYYIGKHFHRGEDLSNDKYAGSGDFCYSYYKKYGKREGVTYIKEILEINPSDKINNDREIFHIGDLWKTDKLCMNLAPGGRGSVSRPQRERVYQIDVNGHVVAIHDNQLAAAYSINAADSTGISKCCLNKHNTYMGYIWKFEKDMDNFDISTIDVSSKPIIQYSKDWSQLRTYNSIKSAVFENNWKDDSGISACCMRRRNSAYGFVWRFYNDPLNLEDLNNIRFSGKRKVLKKKGDAVLCVYNSIAEAARENNVKPQTIQRVCAGKRKSTGGYNWSYVEESL